MKRIKGLTSLLTPAVLMGMLAVSCTNNLNDMGGNQSQLKGGVVHTPDAVVWSGNQTFGNTFTGTRSVGYNPDGYGNSYAVNTRADESVITWEPITTYLLDREKEKSYLEDKLPEQNENIEGMSIDFLYYATEDVSLDFYPIYGISGWRHKVGLFYYDTQGVYHKMDPIWKGLAMNNDIWGSEGESDPYESIASYTMTEVEPGKWENVYISKGFRINIKRGYRFGFYWTGNDNDGETTWYTINSKNSPAYRTDGNGNHLQPESTSVIHAVTFYDEKKNQTYLGIEDWTDFDFQDIVFTCPYNLKVTTSDDVLPNIPGDPEECPKCGHRGHTEPTDNCPDCANGGHAPGATGDCLPPCPNVDPENPNSGCTHPEGKHEQDENGNWVCKDPSCNAPDCHPDNSGKGDTVCPNCGHKGHDHQIDDCDECENGGPAEGANGPCLKDDSGDTGNGGSNNPTQKPNNNEVEINLSILDIHNLPNGSQKYDIVDLVSKLSIHVRYPHDVEVILPVPQSIYCDQDDLYILKTHDVGEYVYGGEKNELTYEIGGFRMGEDGKPLKNEAGKLEDTSWTVTLGIEFVPAANDNLTADRTGITDKDGKEIKTGGYIRVYTKNINKELIDFLKYYYGDGINFEVYNYYNRGTQYTTGSYPEITYECLQYNFLSHSFVNFDWNEEGEKVLPDFYINAFNKVNLLPTKGDCYTWIIGDVHANNGVYKEDGIIANDYNTSLTWGENSQRGSYANPYQGTHYNNSDLNWIYTLKAIGGEDSSDMPAAIWPFNDGTSLWQYYRFGGSDTWNWGGLSNSNNN